MWVLEQQVLKQLSHWPVAFVRNLMKYTSVFFVTEDAVSGGVIVDSNMSQSVGLMHLKIKTERDHMKAPLVRFWRSVTLNL